MNSGEDIWPFTMAMNKRIKEHLSQSERFSQLSKFLASNSEKQRKICMDHLKTQLNLMSFKKITVYT